jgi:hypothetical protein
LPQVFCHRHGKVTDTVSIHTHSHIHSLPCTHTHMYTQTHTHSQAHPHMHSHTKLTICTHALTLTHVQTHLHVLILHQYMHTHVLSLALPHTHISIHFLTPKGQHALPFLSFVFAFSMENQHGPSSLLCSVALGPHQHQVPGWKLTKPDPGHATGSAQNQLRDKG